MSACWLAVIAIVVAVTAGARTAAAAPGVVVVGGAAPEARQAVVRAAVAQATVEAGWSAGATALSKADTTAMLQCSDSTKPWSCVPLSLATSGVQRVLIMAVEVKPGEGDAPIFVLLGKLISPAPGSTVVRQRFCENCADDQLAVEATELARQMLREHAVRGGQTVLDIRSEPTGAAILLDGERVGATNGRFNTFPGAHVVVIEKPGYATETRELTAEDGRTAEVSVTLRSTTGAVESPQPEGRPSRLVPGLVVGAGVVALGAGIVLQVTKDGPPLGEAQPSRIYSAPGIGLAIGGAVLVGVGVYLWSRQSAPTSAPAITLVDGGGLVGWSRHY